MHSYHEGTGEVSTVSIDAAFVAIGHDPNTKILVGQVRMNHTTGYLDTLHPSMLWRPPFPLLAIGW